MTSQQFESLTTGDLVRKRGAVNAYMVSANYRTSVTAVRTVDITNPSEWNRQGDIGHLFAVRDLQLGDLIRSFGGDDAWHVVVAIGARITAALAVNIPATRFGEWTLVAKANYEKIPE